MRKKVDNVYLVARHNLRYFFACMRLSVRKDQPFVASNSFSVAESKIFPNWITNAIYYDEEIVGFMMYTKNYEENELYLCRFMIDQNHQGKGDGKAALDKLKDIAMGDENINKMKLSTNPKMKMVLGYMKSLVLLIILKFLR